eukprot:PLAT3900.1.p1 GENE.PLAT3900.1~~PLAT3900.1.p1  ORF type:complete len:246 (-),score=55.23 PLAT3900.1:309-1007(-)
MATARKPRVVALHGLPGVGKRTVGEQLAALTGCKLFHNHLVVDALLALFPFGSAEFIQLRRKWWLEALSTAVSAATVVHAASPDAAAPEGMEGDEAADGGDGDAPSGDGGEDGAAAAVPTGGSAVDIVFTICFESTLQDELPAELEAAVRAAGGELHWCELCCEEEELMRRAADDGRARYGKLRDIPLYKSLLADGSIHRAPAGVAEGCTVDVTHLSAEEAAAAVAREMDLC